MSMTGAVSASPDSSFVLQLLRHSLVSTAIHIYNPGPRALLRSITATFVLLLIFSILGRLWLTLVTRHAPEPYLDEVFHIPQAQVYCDGKYGVWDDKITTPPGLYALTILWNKLSGLSCSVYHLRLFNVDVISYLALVAVISRVRLEQSGPNAPTQRRRYSSYAIGTGANIALFPVLCFFSGLYYTDVISTFVILLAYVNHLGRVSRERTSLLNDFYTLLLGLLALCMRQTNIFWVVVYMGGLEVVHGIKTLHPEPVATPIFSTLSEQLKFYAWRYSLGDIHDPPLNLACPIDLVLCVASVGIAAICYFGTIARRYAWPHRLTLIAFVAFVAWNGGVVLGDKSNHVATLHLAQMLYIWPLFAFFSAPLFIPQLLNLAGQTYYAIFASSLVTSSTLPPKADDTAKVPADKTRRGSDQKTAALRTFNYIGSSHVLHAVLATVSALVLATLIVRFNTIIHPFTLADNRHYMFYVFRHSILRAWWVRYALVPVYIVCAWLCWSCLQGNPPSLTRQKAEWINTPFVSICGPARATPRSQSSTTKKTTTDTTDAPPPTKAQKTATPSSSSSSSSSTTAPPPTSTVLLLLLSTTLSLTTAPLVEPRYFILPWVFWRLLVPAWAAPPTTQPDDSGGVEQATPPPPPSKFLLGTRLLSRLGGGGGGGDGDGDGDGGNNKKDARLVLETAWFAAVNLATMYVFVARPFYWRALDGSGALLDGGRVQRFMW
ncbi:glycosyltransferase family 59 protein [Xylariaceae sp. FL0662B]|nr:glycosyltransferase family 59 protein [Xylariaceae sp. FL0662B]